MKLYNSCTAREKLQRWLRLKRVVSGVGLYHPEQFDMTTYLKKTECGTVACAAGHAMMDPWFQRQGFCLPTASVAGLQTVNAREATDLCRQFFGDYGTACVLLNSMERLPGQVCSEIDEHVRASIL